MQKKVGWGENCNLQRGDDQTLSKYNMGLWKHVTIRKLAKRWDENFQISIHIHLWVGGAHQVFKGDGVLEPTP